MKKENVKIIHTHKILGVLLPGLQVLAMVPQGTPWARTLEQLVKLQPLRKNNSQKEHVETACH